MLKVAFEEVRANLVININSTTNSLRTAPHGIKVDTRIPVIKPLHAKWVVQFYDYIRSHPDIVINGWKKSKIPEVHSEQNVNLDPFA